MKTIVVVTPTNPRKKIDLLEAADVEASPPGLWDETTEVVTAQTTDGTSWVTAATIPIPAGKSVEINMTFIAHETPSPTRAPGQAVSCSRSWRGLFSRAGPDAPVTVNESGLWSITSGSTPTSRFNISGNSVQCQIRGEASFTLNWHGRINTITSP